MIILKKNIALITVYNKKSLVDEMIMSAQNQKNVDIEYIMTDNTNKKFPSAAKALNYGFYNSSAEVIVFLHQDIEFLSDNVLEYIYNYAMAHRDVVFGAAGVQDKSLVKNVKILSGMKEGEQGRYDTLTTPQRVLTLDECLIACHRDCLKIIRFDEELCDGWHLYGADLCLQAQDFAGLKVEAVPLDVWHKSSGNADESYFRTQNKLAKKYRKYHKIINTTNGYQYTNAFKRLLINLMRKIKYRG